MDNQIILSNLDQIQASNITFTPAQWMQFTAQINYDMGVTLWVGLIIGCIVGAAGMYLGLWYGAKR